MKINSVSIGDIMPGCQSDEYENHFGYKNSRFIKTRIEFRWLSMEEMHVKTTQLYGNIAKTKTMNTVQNTSKDLFFKTMSDDNKMQCFHLTVIENSDYLQLFCFYE